MADDNDFLRNIIDRRDGTLRDIGKPSDIRLLTIQPDLAAFVADMATQNGISESGYVNNIIERGVRAELADDHTDESVWLFMDDLRANKKCNWSLLVRRDK